MKMYKWKKALFKFDSFFNLPLLAVPSSIHRRFRKKKNVYDTSVSLNQASTNKHNKYFNADRANHLSTVLNTLLISLLFLSEYTND